MSRGTVTPVYEVRCVTRRAQHLPTGPWQDFALCGAMIGRLVSPRIRQVTQVAGCHTPQITSSGTMSGRQSRWDENVSHGTPGACNQWHLDDLHAIRHSVILAWLLPYTTFCLHVSVAFMTLYDNTDKGMKPVYLTYSNFLRDISIPPNLKTPMWYGLSQPRAAASRSQARRFWNVELYLKQPVSISSRDPNTSMGKCFSSRCAGFGGLWASSSTIQIIHLLFFPINYTVYGVAYRHIYLSVIIIL